MFHFGPKWGIKDEERMTKIRHYTTALKFCDELNANFVLYFSSYSSMKM